MSSSNLNQNEKKPVEDYLKRADTIMDKRFLYFAFSVLGKNVEVQTKDGAKGKGKFHTASIDNGGVVIKNFTPQEGSNEKLPTKVLDVSDFVYILAPEVEEPPLINAKKNVFKTDTEISKNKLSDQRTFVKWDFEGETLGSGGLTLEDSAHEKGKWNQFELNEKRFGLQSHYEEGMYTTHLDMKNVSATLLEKASRLEAEILGSGADTDNRHIREERGLQALQEEHEDEEFTYSSVYRTDPKKGDTKADDDKKPPRFINTKRQPSNTPTTTTTTTDTPQKSTNITSAENKKEAKPLEVSSNRRDFVPSGNSNTATNALATDATPLDQLKTVEETATGTRNERTPKAATELLDNKKLSRQASNISEGKKHSLSVTSGAFDAEGKFQANEAKLPPVKQGSLDLDLDKKIPTLTSADFHPTLTTKFKLKLTDKDIKKSCVSFFEYALPNWQKKPILSDKISDPALVNPSWKIAKSAAQNQTLSKVVTPTSQTTTTTSTPKPLHKPNTNAPPFNANPGMPTNTFNNGMMMGQMGQPFIPGAYNQAPYMNPGMQFMAPVQKFTPGFPMPQPTMPMYGGMQTFVDPNQPNFNMGMNYHAPSHGNRQGGTGNRGYNKNKQQQ